jgi:hypothetical protein
VESLSTVQDSADIAALLCVGARKRAAVINDLIRMTNPELLVALFPELHTAGHQWLHKETPDHCCYDAALVSALGSPIQQVYEAVDGAIGKVIEQLPPDTTVLLTCLGGFRVVESRCGAVAVGRTYLLPSLSSDGASMVPPWLRFHIPLIEPDRQISRIRLSDKTSRLCFRVRRHRQFLNTHRSL